MKSEAVIQTDDPQGALLRLCAHFDDDHDFDVEVLGDRAKITFAEGWCALRVEADGLTVGLKVWDEEVRASTEAFIARHLQRLVLHARRSVSWTRFSGGGVGEHDAPAFKLRMLASVLDRAAALEQRA